MSSLRPRALPVGFIAPCLPTSARQPPCGPEWLIEIKHDGFRVIARKEGKRVRLYSRPGNRTSNQELELRQVAERMGCEIVKIYRDHGISGAKSRDGRPEFDRMCRDAAKRQFNVVMAWSVDRLGRSLQDLVGFLSELHALRIDLYLHQQGIDTTTPA
jgi:hypothetical protein